MWPRLLKLLYKLLPLLNCFILLVISVLDSTLKKKNLFILLTPFISFISSLRKHLSISILIASLLVLNGTSFIFMIPSGFKLLSQKEWKKKLKIPKALLPSLLLKKPVQGYICRIAILGWPSPSGRTKGQETQKEELGIVWWWKYVYRIQPYVHLAHYHVFKCG